MNHRGRVAQSTEAGQLQLGINETTLRNWILHRHGTEAERREPPVFRPSALTTSRPDFPVLGAAGLWARVVVPESVRVHTARRLDSEQVVTFGPTRHAGCGQR
jgi:hypothetical protein